MRTIQVEHCANRAKLRNIGVARANGTDVAFLDSDDLWLPRKLEIQIAQLQRDATCRWGYTYFDHIGAAGDMLPTPSVEWRRDHGGWLLEKLIRLDVWIAMPTVIVERSFFVETGGFDETMFFFEDSSDKWIGLSRLSEISLVPEPLAQIRIHPDNTGRRLLEVRTFESRMYQRLMRDPELVAQRQLCKKQYARALLQVAGVQRDRREYRRALKAIACALAARPVSGFGWFKLLKTLLHPVIPSPALRWYHAARKRLRK